MGRHEYLTRLALGRSPFAEVEEDSDALTEEGGQAQSQSEPQASSDQPYVQQYDAKGRPHNPATVARNSALRNAENAALALVGVVERKDKHERITDLKYRNIAAARAKVLAEEHNAGEELSILTIVLCPINYAIEVLIQRIQAGLFEPSASFADILRGSFGTVRHVGLASAILPGVIANIIHYAAHSLLEVVVGGLFNYASKWFIKQKLRRRAGRRIQRFLAFTMEALLLALDAALLPLEYHAYSQQLGLAPTLPLLPSWRVLLPWDPTSYHQFIWSASTTLPILHRICSPAALLLFQNFVLREQDDRVPIAGQITPFRYPDPFNTPARVAGHPDAHTDPLGWLMGHGYVLRSKLMRFFGYTLEHRSRLEQHQNDYDTADSITQDLENDSSSDEDDEHGDGLRHVHRSTDLAHLAPEYLANSIDGAYSQILLLPLQALIVRSVTRSYLASSLPKTAFALAAMPYAYKPFGGARGTSWTDRGSYLSKLGLGLSLSVASSTTTFFVLWALSRWQGRRNFDWGIQGMIGGLIYPTEGEE